MVSFLFDVSVVLLVVGAAAGELDGGNSLGEVAVEWLLRNCEPLSESKPREGKGERIRYPGFVGDAGFPLPQMALCSVQPWISTVFDSIGEHAGEGIAQWATCVGFEEDRGGIHSIGWF